MNRLYNVEIPYKIWIGFHQIFIDLYRQNTIVFFMDRDIITDSE